MINQDLQILRNIVNNDLLKFMVNNKIDEIGLKEIILDNETELLKCDYKLNHIILECNHKVVDIFLNNLFSCHNPELVDNSEDSEDNVYNKPKWFENNDYDICLI